MKKIKPFKKVINGVTVDFSVDKKTGVTRLKVDGPNPEIEKKVGLAMLELLKTTAKCLGEEVKVIKMGQTN